MRAMPYTPTHTKGWSRRKHPAGHDEVCCPVCEQWVRPQGAMLHSRMVHGASQGVPTPELEGAPPLPPEPPTPRPEAAVDPSRVDNLELLNSLLTARTWFKEQAWVIEHEDPFPFAEDRALLALYKDLGATADELQVELAGSGEVTDSERAQCLFELASLIHSRASLLGEPDGPDAAELDEQIASLRECVVDHEASDSDF